MKLVRIAFLSFAALALLLGRGAAAQSSGTEWVLLSEPLWLLQVEGIQELVWFEEGPDGVVMVSCPHATSCRHAVRIDEKGLTLLGRSTAQLATGRVGWDVPIFTDKAATALMPAWVVPATTARTGH